MTPAEKRIKELIERWLTSIELHLQYTSLPDDAYWKVQNWPKHDRPTRWVLESAKQKANELKEVFESRHAMGDSKFAEALELTNFLANLVGVQHIDRFVPLAEPKGESAMPQPIASARPAPISPPPPPSSDVPSWYIQATQRSEQPARTAVVKPAQASPPPKPEPPRPPLPDPDATREMPKVRAQPQPPIAEVAPPLPKSEPRKSPPPKPVTAPAKQTAKGPAAPNAVQQTLINDAVRLLNWGRTWHELAELIARMADRPSLGEVRKILRTYRSTIEKTAKESKS